ncbi:MAG: hypothetical protein H0X31_00365 [Nostocaceae cyanobacterium]|nr:hypothetical protein [Nostocaceae cyanobacterium]
MNNDAVQRAKLQRQATDYVKEGIFWTGVQLGRTIPALTIMGMCGAAGCGVGILIGLNGLPSAVACSTVRSWCYSLRANKSMTVAPELPFVDEKEAAPLKKKSKKRS